MALQVLVKRTRPLTKLVRRRFDDCLFAGLVEETARDWWWQQTGVIERLHCGKSQQWHPAHRADVWEVGFIEYSELDRCGNPHWSNASEFG
jgi:hypothetical protein